MNTEAGRRAAIHKEIAEALLRVRLTSRPLGPTSRGIIEADLVPVIERLIAAHTEAALIADRLARHDETVAAIEAARWDAWAETHEEPYE